MFMGFFAFAAVFLLLASFREAYAQYQAWRLDPLAKFYLPPYQSWAYFALYVGSRFIFPAVIAIAAGFAGIGVAKVMNRRYGERFFEREEPYLFGLGLVALGYPGFLFYLIFLGISTVFWTLMFRARGYERAPFYFLWLSVALVAILIVYRLIPPDALLKFNL